jgi:hypothetical protein
MIRKQPPTVRGAGLKVYGMPERRYRFLGKPRFAACNPELKIYGSGLRLLERQGLEDLECGCCAPATTLRGPENESSDRMCGTEVQNFSSLLCREVGISLQESSRVGERRVDRPRMLRRAVHCRPLPARACRLITHIPPDSVFQPTLPQKNCLCNGCCTISSLASRSAAPVPSHSEFDVVAALRLEHDTRLSRRRDLQTQLFQDAADLGDLLGVRERKLPLAGVQAILQPDAHVAS